MKLRLRSSSSNSRETLKIETPNPCNLTQLKQIISQSLPNSPSPNSILISLNRQDPLQSNGSDSLHSLGIASGDLLYFSLPPNSPISQNTPPTTSNTQNTPPVPISDSVTISDSEMEEMVNYNNNNNTYDDMEIVVDKSFSVPGFLRKVFISELGNDSGRDHKLLVIAVHAVMLDSGFVGFDKTNNVVVNKFQLSNEWPSGLFSVSLFYTLPNVVSSGASNEKAVKCVMLKFQGLGKFVNVYGTLVNGTKRRGTHRVELNEEELVSYLNVVWANCGVTENVVGDNGDFSVEKEVFKFWRGVKDNLMLPLLIDLCEEAGLVLPPCFMRLPTDLKLKILEMLPGVDVARVSCTSSEMRYLGSSDDLWKLKFEEEYPTKEKEVSWMSWKEAFGKLRERKKYATIVRRVVPHWPTAPYWAPHRRGGGSRFPFSVGQRGPRIIGGDYDMGPVFGGGGDGLPNRVQNWGSNSRRNFSLQCIPGVRGGRNV